MSKGKAMNECDVTTVEVEVTEKAERAMRLEYTPLTARAKEQIAQVKEMSAGLWSLLDELQQGYWGDVRRDLALAKTHLEDSCMRAVRALTSPNYDVGDDASSSPYKPDDPIGSLRKILDDVTSGVPGDGEKMVDAEFTEVGDDKTASDDERDWSPKQREILNRPVFDLTMYRPEGQVAFTKSVKYGDYRALTGGTAYIPPENRNKMLELLGLLKSEDA
jgi:hypothetical protein